MGNKTKNTKRRVQAESKPTVVTLTTESGSADLVVKPVNRWADDAVENLEHARMRAWATAVLSAEDLSDWIGLAPTLEEAFAFVGSYQEKSGTDVGESEASTDS